MPHGKLMPEHELAIQKNFQFLLNELDASKIVDFLYERQVISFDDHERIFNGETRKLQNRELLKMILNAGPGDAFDHFIESLSKDFKHVQEKLLKTVACSQVNCISMNGQREQLGRKINTNLDFFVIGKTGNGKSALGNTVLGRKVFKSVSSISSVTEDIEVGVSEADGRTIKLVDGPGVYEPDRLTEENTKMFIDKMSFAISLNPEGFHAFLLVLKYGCRFTQEEDDAIIFLKKIFGESFIKDFCILVIVNGDSFREENEKGRLSFKEWCDTREGKFRELLEECGWRVVLFDNRTQDPYIKKSQQDRLFQMVDKLALHGHRYKNKDFHRAQGSRNRLMIESKHQMIQELKTEVYLLYEKLQQSLELDDPSKTSELLSDLMERATWLHDSIVSQDNKTGALYDLVKTVQIIRVGIQTELTMAQKILRELEKYRNKLFSEEQFFEAEKIKWQNEKKKKKKKNIFL